MKKEYVISWFVENSSILREEIEENMCINYLEDGLIDSFAFLALISACEEQFDIQFSDEDFQNDKIFTIEGLIEILEDK